MLTNFSLSVQTFLMAVEPNNTDLPDTNPGPTDDGYIAVAEKSIPQDPFCCSGPIKDEIGQSLCLSIMPDPMMQIEFLMSNNPS